MRRRFVLLSALLSNVADDSRRLFDGRDASRFNPRICVCSVVLLSALLPSRVMYVPKELAGEDVGNSDAWRLDHGGALCSAMAGIASATQACRVFGRDSYSERPQNIVLLDSNSDFSSH